MYILFTDPFFNFSLMKHVHRLIIPFILLLWLAGCSSLQNPESISMPAVLPITMSHTGVTRSTEGQMDFEKISQTLIFGDQALAEKLLIDFVALHPGYVSPLINLGIIYLQAERFELAVSTAKDAIKLEPELCRPRMLLGLSERKLGHFVKAENAYRSCVDMTPDYAPAYLNLGILYELYIGDLPSALLNFEKFQTLEDSHKQVAGWIANLSRRVKNSEHYLSNNSRGVVPGTQQGTQQRTEQRAQQGVRE